MVVVVLGVLVLVLMFDYLGSPIVAQSCSQDKLWQLLPAGRLQIHRFASGLSPGLRGGADFLLQEWGGESTHTQRHGETRSNKAMF